MTAVLFRRRRLGLGSCQGIVAGSERDITIRTHNPLRRTYRREGPWPNDTSLVIRWGCTAAIPVDCNRVLNTAEAIHFVNNKSAFRMLLDEHGLCPSTFTDYHSTMESGIQHILVRPNHHAQGRRMYVVDMQDGGGDLALSAAFRRAGAGAYASEIVDKSAEYRVFVAQGRCVWVARKTPGNPQDIAWNVARGGRFDNVRFGDWPLRVVRVAIEAFNLSGLDFGGVDVIVDQEGRAYVIEINSAPSQTSPYRQSCVAQVFDYIIQHGKAPIPLKEERGGWKKFIHPALSTAAEVP